MSNWQIIKLAWAGIKANKLRSFLTMLGVIIGVAAVIILVSIAQGTSQSVTGRIQGLGSNLVSVSLRSSETDDTLAYEEVLKWQERPGVKGVAPVLNGNVTVKYGNKKYDTSLEGVTPEYEEVRNFHTQRGRFLLDSDVSLRQRVALVGTEVAKELFGQTNPVGKTIKINGENFVVVGLLEAKGAASFGSNDDKVMIPLSTAERLLNTRGIRFVYVQATSPEDVDGVVAQLDNLLYRKLKNTDAYRVFSQAEMLSTVSQVTGMLTLMLGGIAGISLLVGGIGIMNIMLVTVTERTREIGIRKAIGARRRDILRQFLIEALVVSGAGGLFGIVLGVAGSKLLNQFFGVSAAISWQIIGIAFGFALLVGVIFGIYPANKAAKLNPIEALRYQ
ncbi:ABC transporter permease [Carboxydocella sp. JDF658]|uniref:ABC transporter permease n=1 Tax=Carboxydocella sp. JDF658 TaxID=1926600 RepID=UPI0009AE0EFE|nr:ABC transporter permease [Carboxydocella sp. JDF658]GAW31090.1 ABC transporter permease [Carboxydocella sp. JDF658]